MPSSVKSGTLFNTFRAHLVLLRAAVSDPNCNDVPQPDGRLWNNSPTESKLTTDIEVGRAGKRRRKSSSPNGSSVSNSLQNQKQGVGSSWSWSEQIFFSQDDEDVTVYDEDDDYSFDGQEENDVNASVVPVVPNAGEEAARDDETCTNTVAEKTRQRSRKASRASTVGAFVTFLKALFGIGMLSNPAVLGEVGLVLGTFCHLFIVVGCAFACYLLLSARKLAKNEVKTREELEMRQINDQKQLEQSENSRRQRKGEKVRRKSNMMPRRTRSGSSWTKSPSKTDLDASIIPPTVSWERRQDASKTVPQSSSAPQPSTEGVERQWPISTVVTVETEPDQSMAPTPRRAARHRRKNSEMNKSAASAIISDEYRRLPDESKSSPAKTQSSSFASEKPKKSPPVRLVTYGDVAKYLAGPTLASFVVFTIVTVHLMFASGMVHIAVENLCYVTGWDKLGWSYTGQFQEDMDEERRLSGSSQDNEENLEGSEAYAEWDGPDFTGRLAMASLLFPIIQGLLQIPSLKELTSISSIGLMIYVFGCIGSMMYEAIVLSEGHPFLDQPADMWQTKWSGIPTYVATTIYAIEGINLALPTASSLEGSNRVRWAGNLMRRKAGSDMEEKERPDRSIFIVVCAVCIYGMVTFVVSWVGLAVGLGGGVGTNHGEDGCRDVTYCFDSSSVRYVYMLSLGVALVLTLPVILYPSTEMLEIWLDEREDERRRKMENASLGEPSTPPKTNEKSMRRTIREKSLLEDDETVTTVPNSPIPMIKREVSIKNDHAPPWADDRYLDENGHLSLDTITNSGSENFDAGKTNTCNIYNAPTCSPVELDAVRNLASGEFMQQNSVTTDKSRGKARRKLKYWKLRMFLAFIICFIGTLEGSFPDVLKASEIIRGVGLSFAGLIFPPLLYMSAVGGRFSAAMASAMALLIGLGLFNMVLVLMSVLAGKSFIVEEGPGHF